VPIPGNPWPHEMAIHLDESPGNLVELLYIHESWHLVDDMGIPALDPIPEPGTSAAPTSETIIEWSRRWGRLWFGALEWYSGSLEDVYGLNFSLRDRLRTRRPPFWSSEYGRDGIDEAAFTAWQRQLEPEMDAALEMQPERLSLTALVGAWESGLHTVVTLPYAGYYARRISPTHMLVSTSTRSNPETYARALATRD